VSTQKVTLSNGIAQATVLPEIGGRIISFKSLGREWLWRNPSLVSEQYELLIQPEEARSATTLGNWRNWGGDKSWPAPQGWSTDQEWAGPPDPILDSGAYTASVSPDQSTCHLVSLADPRTGLQIERTVSMRPGHAGLTVKTTMTNTSPTTRRWACWTVTQVVADKNLGGHQARVVIDHEDEDRQHVVLFAAVGQQTVRVDANGNLEVPLEDVVAKVGFPSASGVIRFVNEDGYYFQQSFAVDKAGIYPDKGSRAEVWMQFPVSAPIDSLQGLTLDARLVEMECLSPLTTLRTGENVSLAVEWFVGEEDLLLESDPETSHHE